MRLFISHVHEEKRIAVAIREELVACFGKQIDVFLAEEIPLGTNWFEEIKTALVESEVIVVLFSKFSSTRPWINIEAGYGVMAGKRVFPICHSGFSKAKLPVIYGLLQAVELLERSDVERLLAEIAKSTAAGAFLGDQPAAVERWIERMSDSVPLVPEGPRSLEAPPCVWVLGSNRGLRDRQAALNKRLVGEVAQVFMERSFRVIFGRSGLLDRLGEATASTEAEASAGQGNATFGLDHETLSSFGNAAAMRRNAEQPPPNPLVILGSLRAERGVRALFVDSVGHVPDVALLIGGSTSGRALEEVVQAEKAQIPVFPLRFTGGLAAKTQPSLHNSLDDAVGPIQTTRRDYSFAVQKIYDIIEKQARIGRGV